jgi:hypothetical protein
MRRHLLIILNLAWAKTWKNKVGRNALIHVLAAGRTNSLCTMPLGNRRLFVVQAKPGARRGTVVGDGELDHGSDETISA